MDATQINSISDAISKLGFPIVVACALIFVLYLAGRFAAKEVRFLIRHLGKEVTTTRKTVKRQKQQLNRIERRQIEHLEVCRSPELGTETH